MSIFLQPDINEHSDEINKYRKKAEEIFEYFKSFYK